MIRAVATEDIVACVSPQIFDEYQEIINVMMSKLQGKFDENALSLFFGRLDFVLPSSRIKICRDPDDNKFLECAKDSGALYIVSGDKDLLSLGTFGNTQIITARMFCEKCLPNS